MMSAGRASLGSTKKLRHMSTPLRERPDAPLGTLIFRAGLLPAEVIENALEEGVRTGRRLGEILVERGLIKEEDLTRLLAGQKGLPFVPLSEQPIDPEAARLLDEERAKLFCALPIGFEDGAPVVAVADPTNEVLTRNVSEAIGRDPRFVVAARSDLLEAISRAYSPILPGPAPIAAPAEPIAPAEPVGAGPVPAEPAPAPETAPEPAPSTSYETNGHIPDLTIEATPASEPAPVVPPTEPAPAEPVAETEPVGGGLAPPEPEPAPTPAPEQAPMSQAEPAPAPPAAEAPAAEPPAPPPAEATSPQPAAVTPPSLRVPAPEPVQEGLTPPEDEPVEAALAQPEPEPQTTSPAARVTIRLTTGERVPVADFPTLDGAKEHARVLIRDLAESGDEWPLVNGRFLRPDTIVSVDVESL